ncbi:GNA1162 family protein [Thermodesulfovibrio thiophilus]|uniref:GNA1162 family protein n=1 Tax=Thermodesulfovibrio thiophilus TaxID=340095 RepID=UPI0004137C4D|nr:GNA1162 family protein [Thermodesulfovibrio thiophilus]
MRKFLIILGVLAFVFACSPLSETKKDIQELTIPSDELPKIVAVLPFENNTEEKGIGNQVRKAFYNHFSSKPYIDIELNVVDEKIIQLEKSRDKSILEIPSNEICQFIGCDGLIYGKVTDYKKIYAVAYSQLGVEAEVWLINAKTGKEVFRIKDSVRYHEGGIPLSPLSAVMTAVSNAMNIRDIQQVRMINELCYKFNEKIPAPAGITIEERPVIKEVLTNAKNSPFGKGKIIQVGAEGDKGMVATFDIGNFKKGISMKETQPGIYIGEYVVLPGDNVKEAPIVVSLRKIAGYETQWIDVSGFVTIDTTPPPQVKGLRAKGFNDRIEILWEQVKNVHDLKGYKILRSEQALTGFKEIGRVEINFFEDKDVQYGKHYYYRVIAFDDAENESEIQDAVKASLTNKEPQILSGTIEKDLVLSGVYIVKDFLKIPSGLTLKVEPESRIMFNESAIIIVEGRIEIDAGELSVEFIPLEQKKWKGIEIKNGYVMMKGFRIKHAENGINISASGGVLQNGIITDCYKGISIFGIPSPLLQNLTVSGSDTGIELIKTNTKLLANNIFQNKTGIKVNGFSGEIKDNNIFDNTINIFSEKPVKIDANYFGSINLEEMRLEKVQLSRVYDDKTPEGKVVSVIINPYAVLSIAERQKKATEFIAEAGNYFRKRNYGKAVILFEEALKAEPSAEGYYYTALCYHEMKEDEKALNYLKEGVNKFPMDSGLKKSLGLIYYQIGKTEEARKIFEEVLRLNPEDSQIKFLIERIDK